MATSGMSTATEQASSCAELPSCLRSLVQHTPLKACASSSHLALPPIHSLPGNASSDAIGRASVGDADGSGCQLCCRGYYAED